MGVFTFFKLYKWYQIAQRITYELYIYDWKLPGKSTCLPLHKEHLPKNVWYFVRILEMCLMKVELLRDHSFRTYAKYSKKLIFLKFFGTFCARTKWMISEGKLYIQIIGELSSRTRWKSLERPLIFFVKVYLWY